MKINPELLRNLKTQKFGSCIMLDSENIPIFPEEYEMEDFHIEIRHRYISSGLIDNLIFHMGKDKMIILGLWFLSASINGSKFCRLNLVDPKSKIKSIFLDIEEENPKIELKSFNWEVQNIESFMEDFTFYFGHKASFQLVNEEEEYFTQEDYSQRDILKIFGGVGAFCLLAEFFLNLGLECSDVNYEYLKYEYARSLADNKSCEVRAEVL